jgi:23S rRNA (cytosine1962-C5)-methyltransferase
MAAPGRLPEVRLRRKGARRWASLHPWIFSDDLEAAPEASSGDVVRVVDDAGRPFGLAHYSARSKIALRRIAFSGEGAPLALWDARVASAFARRDGEVAGWEARRLLFAESDGVPGLIADLYGSHLILQAATAGAERAAEEVAAAIASRTTVASVLMRNDAAVRSLEGLPREVRQLRGTTPDAIVVAEGEAAFEIDPWRGQKTGAFLDQRENRIAAGALARGRVYDGFTYHGSFAIHAARRAEEVVAVDASGAALERGRSNAARSGVANVSFVEANVFDDLRERERRGERFDTIVLDPPAFAKSRRDAPAAQRGYKELNLRALRLLTPGGILVTSSCSYNLSEPSFEDVLRAAAADARREVGIVARRGQARDHPVLLGFPESRYLKCSVLECRGAAV